VTTNRGIVVQARMYYVPAVRDWQSRRPRFMFDRAKWEKCNLLAGALCPYENTVLAIYKRDFYKFDGHLCLRDTR